MRGWERVEYDLFDAFYVVLSMSVCSEEKLAQLERRGLSTEIPFTCHGQGLWSVGAGLHAVISFFFAWSVANEQRETLW